MSVRKSLTCRSCSIKFAPITFTPSTLVILRLLGNETALLSSGTLRPERAHPYDFRVRDGGGASLRSPKGRSH